MGLALDLIQKFVGTKSSIRLKLRVHKIRVEENALSLKML